MPHVNVISPSLFLFYSTTFNNQKILNSFLLTSPTTKMEQPLMCVISFNTNATLIKVNSATSIVELKMQASENLRVPYESMLISYSLEKFPNVLFELLKDEDILNMIDYHRSMGLNTITMTVTERGEGSTHATGTETELNLPNVSSQSSEHIEESERIPIEESERIPNDNPQGEHVWVMDDIVSDSTRIPAWWHEAITGNGQQFESAKEVRMALIYYSIAKKFAFKYINNEPKRIRARCMFRKDTQCPWLLYASRLSHVSTFAVKKFVPQHTCGQHNSTASHSRASRRWIASMLQSIMKRRPYITPTDIRKELHTQYGIKVNYSKAWRAKETAKEQIFGCARHSYDLLSWLVH